MRVLHTNTSFAVYFPSIQHSAQKKVFPCTSLISQFSFTCSIPNRNQELFSDHLLGQFPQNLSDSCHFQVAWTLAILCIT